MNKSENLLHEEECFGLGEKINFLLLKHPCAHQYQCIKKVNNEKTKKIEYELR